MKYDFDEHEYWYVTDWEMPGLKAALALARDGYRVFPAYPDKRPACKWNAEASKNGFAVNELWFTHQKPDSPLLVGLPCGSNNLVVLDFDTYKQGSENCLAEFEHRFGYDLSDHPYVVRSQSGGLHYYFKVPCNLHTSNKQDWLGIRGLDVRGDGGYVIAEDGHRYVSITGSISATPDLPVEIAACFENHRSKKYSSNEMPITDDDLFLDRDNEGIYWTPDARLVAALNLIPLDDRDEWIKVGMALHYESDGSENAFACWDKLSQKSSKYGAEHDTRYHWKSFDTETADPVTEATIFHIARKYGSNDEMSSPEFKLVIPEHDSTQPSRFADVVMGNLKETFEKHKHSPSISQLSALEDIAGCISDMADGTAKPLVYLSAVDPGIGKTQTVIHSVAHLVSSGDHDNVGVLILVSRLAEIRKLVKEMKLPIDKFAVIVSNTNANTQLNKYGNSNKQEAQVLFTTQQMLEMRCRGGKKFQDLVELHYEGRPRSVRIWDEAALPGRPISIEVADIESCNSIIRDELPATLETVRSFIKCIHGSEHRGTVEVPDFGALVEAEKVMEVISDSGAGDKILRLLGDLWFLSGKPVVVRKDGNHKTVIDYENTLPDDLKPLLVLDASGRVRQTYNHWSDGRGDLLKLKYAEKDYSNLTIHLWKRGGGKSSQKKDPHAYADGIAKTIMEKSDEKWLIVHFKKDKKFDLPQLLKASLPEKVWSNVSLIHWGDHSATNEHRDTENVILAGTLFYSKGDYESLGRLSRGIASEEELTLSDLEEIEAGEHMHAILQAACRGSVRKSVGAGCHPCHLYIIACNRSGIPSLITRVFPSCKVGKWLPIPRELNGKKRDAFELIVKLMDLGRSEVQVSDVYNRLDMDKSDFHSSILKSEDFIQSLEYEGVVVETGKGRQGSRFVRC